MAQKFQPLKVVNDCVHVNSVVVDSRKKGSYNEVTWRRRLCEDCGVKFSTLEKRI